MSFGCSVGDIGTVGKLIVDIIGSLQDAGGAKSEYQALIRELESLQEVLSHLDRLGNCNDPSTTVESTKLVALSCQYPLRELLQKIRKYERPMGVRSRSSVFKSTAAKLRFSALEKGEVQRLQSYLSVQIGIINMLVRSLHVRGISTAMFPSTWGRIAEVARRQTLG